MLKLLKLVLQAIAAALMPHCKKMKNAAFGSWSSDAEDGLQYQERVRAEW